jgi:RNA polymerase primary sigma factor
MKQPNILTEIVSGAKKRGYITQEEILSIFPHPEEHIAELDQLYDKLMRSEIDVFESVAAESDEEKPIEVLEKELEALTVLTEGTVSDPVRMYLK